MSNVDFELSRKLDIMISNDLKWLTMNIYQFLLELCL
jgi:hypothetical protein